ncbi:MAG: hypothetical protein H6P96_1058, partial [Candidatus Aminicenantes bacterium]|nr:hypothetical protein [Candidatus Aminicenantes bacterium]
AVVGPGSVCSRRQFLQNRNVDRLVGHQLLQPNVFPFQGLQALQLFQAQPPIHCPPAVMRLLADSQLLADLRRRLTSCLLPTRRQPHESSRRFAPACIASSPSSAPLSAQRRRPILTVPLERSNGGGSISEEADGHSATHVSPHAPRFPLMRQRQLTTTAISIARSNAIPAVGFDSIPNTPPATPTPMPIRGTIAPR